MNFRLGTLRFLDSWDSPLAGPRFDGYPERRDEPEAGEAGKPGPLDNATRDLLTDLPRGHPDRESLIDLYAMLRDRDAGLDRVKLIECQWNRGLDDSIAVAVADMGLRARVRATDVVHGGLGVVLDHGSMRVFPRYVRQVSTSGIVPPGALDKEAPIASLEDSMTRALSVTTFRAVVDTLRVASRVTVSNVGRVLESSSLRQYACPIHDAWLRDNDFTVYGIYNAIAVYAKGLSSLSHRFEVEFRAARVLARFESARSVHHVSESAIGC